MPVVVTLIIAVAIAIAGDTVLSWVRPRIDRHRTHPREGIWFRAFFIAYAAALIVWLIGGVVPALERLRPSLHERLHRAGGNSSHLVLAAAGYQFDRPNLEFQAGRLTTILFTNKDGRVKHNFGLYEIGTEHFAQEPGGGTYSLPLVEVFASKAFAGRATREFSFVAPSPGEYLFRCDIEDPDPAIGFHGDFMFGWAHVAPAAAAPAPPSGFVARTSRGAANAFHYAEPAGEGALDYVFSIATLGLGIFLIRRRPLDRVARLLGVGMMGTAAAYNIQSHAALDVVPAVANVIHPLFVHPISGMAYLYALVLFPDGKLVPQFSRRLVRLAYRGFVFWALTLLLIAGDLFEPAAGPGHATAFVQSFALLIPLVGFSAQAYRYRHTESAELKQQSKLLLWALTPALAFGLAVVALRALGGSSGTFGGASVHDLESITFRLFQPIFIVIPAAIIVGILRYRMWDLDIVVNKAILYGALAAFIGAMYVAVVVGIGQLAGTGRRPALSVAALVAVAVGFEPVRERAQRFANGLVYGSRATPYEVMANFSHSMAQTVSVLDVLPLTAEAAARCIGGTAAQIVLHLPDGGTRTASWPDGADGGSYDRTLPVWHQGDLVGEISVRKAPGNPLTTGDERVLSAVAAQAGLSLRSARLTAELQANLATISAQATELAASRQRIVSARDEERRRLELEIRGAVERKLAAVERSIRRSEKMVAKDPAKAAAVFASILKEATVALDRLRTISRGIFPPLLADQGLAPALEGQLRTIDSKQPVTIETAGDGARFDPHAEASVFFCCVEAVKEAARREKKGSVKLRVRREGPWVEFTIIGGRPPIDPALVQHLTDRVEALGGRLDAGTTPDGTASLTGRVPAQIPADAHAVASASGSSSALEM
jgi:signal transduction histidine kinase